MKKVTVTAVHTVMVPEDEVVQEVVGTSYEDFARGEVNSLHDDNTTGTFVIGTDIEHISVPQ